MPQLGETVTEGTVGRWLKKPGEQVAKYEPLLEVETDKVASEIPSPFAGTLSTILADEGATVPVGAPVCEILAVGEAPSAPAPAPAAAPATAPAPDTAVPPVTATAITVSPPAPIAAAPAPALAASAPSTPAPAAVAPAAAGESSGQNNGARHSPAVRRLARMHHIDLSSIAGSGRGGRLTARDVISHVENAAQAPASVAPPPAPRTAPAPPQPAAAATVAAKPSSPAPAIAPPQPAPAATSAATAPAAPIKIAASTVQPLPIAPPGPEDTVIRLSPMRKTIAERMVLSKTTIPHAWSMVEADVTALVKWRSQEKDAFKAREGVNLTYLPIVIQAVCGAIREYPMVNATWAGDSIIQRRHINIGVAVDIEEGLVVPVIRDADRYSLAGLATTINELAARARARKLTMDDLTDGTITVDNTGSLGSISSYPIINPPQAAIITTEAIVRRPWVVDDAIAIRHIMNLCLSLDHRVLDGAVASHFLQAVKKRLETYSG
jgi:2-oxoisovalerate dehydrogenase E2 component (dihydrolipoyl transacylase)